MNLLFLLNVACFWFGCNNAAKELVKERIIFSRERDFNLRLDSYCFSKFLVLVLIAMIQVTLLFGIVRIWCGLPGSPGGQWVVLAILGTAGTALGLMISSLAPTEEVAVALVPLIVMPQIILAGVIAPLSGVAKVLAQFAITVYWAEQSLQGLLPLDQQKMLRLDDTKYGFPLGVVFAHACGFLVATLIMLCLPEKLKKNR